MKLKFIGTRGEIEARTPLHSQHTALLITHARKQVMIDCGADWLGHLDTVRPDAIVITHAHPDHAWGLREGAPCPVFAPEQTWKTLEFSFPGDKKLLPLARRRLRGFSSAAARGVNAEIAIDGQELRLPLIRKMF